MTRAAQVNGQRMHSKAIRSAPLNGNLFAMPSYKIGANTNGIIIAAHEGREALSLSKIVAKETAELLDGRQRPSVRELALKFEKGLNTATWLSNEVKWRQVALLERDVLLKNLMDILESLRDRIFGKNKEEIEKSISMVETLATQLSQREGELLQQKAEVKQLATSLKLASEDAKRIVEEERDNARFEVENARAAVQRVQQALHEYEKLSQTMEKQDVEDLKLEVQEARRIKMLHHRSKVMDMGCEIQVLRDRYAEKSLTSVQLQREIEMHSRLEESKITSYVLQGLECLGLSLHIIPAEDTAQDTSNCSVQWYRIQPQGNKKEAISGATRPAYAPEPFDVGRFLQAEVISGNDTIRVRTAGPIDPAAGLGSYVEALVRKPETEFYVVVVQVNGTDHPSDCVHVLNIGRLRVKLSKGKVVVAKEFYSTEMQLCGVRSGGNAAAQAIFWQAKAGLHFTLAFETARERNAAIMLARIYAVDCNIMLGGPGDRTDG